MIRESNNNKTVFSFAVTDTVAAWANVRSFLAEEHFTPHEEMQDIYYKVDPAVGMQYLQFFKTQEAVQVVTFLGGWRQPVPLDLAGEAGQKAESTLQPLLAALADMEGPEEAAPPKSIPLPGFEKDMPRPVEEEAARPAGLEEEPARTVAFEEEAARTVAFEEEAARPVTFEDESTQPLECREGPSATDPRSLPAGYVGYTFDYDPVNGGKKERASNAAVGLVLGVLGALIGILGLSVHWVSAVGFFVVLCGLLFSINGLKSDKKALALAGVILSGVGAVFLIVAFFADIFII